MTTWAAVLGGPGGGPGSEGVGSKSCLPAFSILAAPPCWRRLELWSCQASCIGHEVESTESHVAAATNALTAVQSNARGPTLQLPSAKMIKIKTSQASLDTHPSCIRESEIFKVGLNMLKLGFYKLELSCRSFGKVACIESPKLRNLDTESWKILKPQADTVREKTTEVEQHSAFVSWNIFQSLTTLQFWHGKKLTCRKLWSRANHGQLNCFG